MHISFEGKKKVIADYNGYRIITDQAVSAGGEGSAPAPFDFFVASIGTCAGIYVKSFCDKRGISTNGITLDQNMKFDPETHMISHLEIMIHLPGDFPEKYKSALVNVANMCAVKRHLLHPPEMTVTIRLNAIEK